jgi:outer membrane protein
VAGANPLPPARRAPVKRRKSTPRPFETISRQFSYTTAMEKAEKFLAKSVGEAMKTVRVFLGVFLFFVSAGLLFAQEAPKTEASKAAVAPAPGAQATQTVTIPESYVERTRKAGAVLDLSMKDAIRLALTNNLDIAIQDFNEDLNRQFIVGIKGFYDPQLNFSVGYRSIQNPVTSILDAGSGIELSKRNAFELQTSVTQNVPGGGGLALSFDNGRSASNSFYSTMNPTFSSTLDLQFTQPLWRGGFRQTDYKRQLNLQNLDNKISDSQFEDRVASVVQLVQNQYWNLVFAIENHETRRQSMELAIVQLNDNQKRVEIGVMAPIEITKSRAAVASREQEMIQSEVQIIQAENELKQLLAPDPKASIWSLSVLPKDRPAEQPITISLDEAINRGLARRPEVEQVRLRKEKLAVDRKYYRNQGKPAFNLVAGLSSAGAAGTVYAQELLDLDGDGVPETPGPRVPVPNAPFYGAFGKSIPDAFGFKYVSYSVALNVQMPLWGNRVNEAARAEVEINDRILSSQLKSAQQQIMVDVRNAYQGLQTQKKGLEAARVARQLAEEQLAGENKRFEAGLSTNFEVLTYQQDLATARVSELRALIDYEQAVTALQRAMYTIVDDSDIVLAKTQNSDSSK